MKSNHKLLFGLSIFWLFMILLMGGWWLFLLLKMDHQLNNAGITGPNYLKMVQYEGTTFIVLILAVSATLIFYYIKNVRRTNNLQAFFSSLTHELKTPLASIKLQGDVILAESKKVENQKLEKLCQRLASDVQNLENQMDKVLQLSKVERGIPLNLQEINIVKYFEKTTEEIGQGLKIEVINSINEEIHALADPFGLNIIVKNLVENTKRHANSHKITITISKKENSIYIKYDDGGIFEGDTKRIGQIFEKSKASKGSGIGLYLIKQLMIGMKGRAIFKSSPHFSTNLVFKTE